MYYATWVKNSIIDFSKAFDCVDHSILLHKLQLHSMNGSLLCWFEDYFGVLGFYIDGGEWLLRALPQHILQ